MSEESTTAKKDIINNFNNFPEICLKNAEDLMKPTKIINTTDVNGTGNLEDSLADFVNKVILLNADVRTGIRDSNGHEPQKLDTRIICNVEHCIMLLRKVEKPTTNFSCFTPHHNSVWGRGLYPQAILVRRDGWY